MRVRHPGCPYPHDTCTCVIEPEDTTCPPDEPPPWHDTRAEARGER